MVINPVWSLNQGCLELAHKGIVGAFNSLLSLSRGGNTGNASKTNMAKKRRGERGEEKSIGKKCLRYRVPKVPEKRKI